MLWGVICSKGVLPFKKVIGLQTKNVPCDFLKIGKGFVFQEDNDPKHSSNLCRNYLSLNEISGFIQGIKIYKFIKLDRQEIYCQLGDIKGMVCPPPNISRHQSNRTNMGSTEDTNTSKTTFKTFQRIGKEFFPKINLEKIQKQCLPDIRHFIEAKGGHTRY